MCNVRVRRKRDDLRRALLALAFAAANLAWANVSASAADSSASTNPCGFASVSEIATILGYPVDGPDATSRTAGICFFSARAISQDGSVTYAVVTDANLPQRRAFAAVQARRCGGVAKVAPNAGVCAEYAAVAHAQDLDAYFVARTSSSDATTVPSLGAMAIAAPDALVVRSGTSVLEIVVRRGENLDVERETSLAKLLLARLASVSPRD